MKGVIKMPWKKLENNKLKKLFVSNDLLDKLRDKQQKLEKELKTIGMKILDHTEEEWFDSYYSKYRIDKLELDKENYHMRSKDPYDIFIGESAMDRGCPSSHMYHVYVPIKSGNIDFFNSKPNPHDYNPPNGFVSGNKLVLIIIIDIDNINNLLNCFQAELEKAEKYLKNVNWMIVKYNKEIETLIKELIATEKEKYVKINSDIGDIPIRF